MTVVSKQVVSKQVVSKQVVSKQAVYCIPGWGMDSHVFQESELGLTSFPLIGLDYAHLTQPSLPHVSYYLASLIPDGANVIAWSLGGLFAIKIAALWPQKIKKLVLLASQPRWLEDASWQGVSVANATDFLSRWSQDATATLRYFLSLLYYPSRVRKIRKYLNNYLLDAQQSQLGRLLELMFTVDLRAEYRMIQVPILHIIGGKDAVVKQQASCLQQLNERTSTVTIECAGHAGFTTHMQQYTNILGTFF